MEIYNGKLVCLVTSFALGQIQKLDPIIIDCMKFMLSGDGSSKLKEYVVCNLLDWDPEPGLHGSDGYCKRLRRLTEIKSQTNGVSKLDGTMGWNNFSKQRYDALMNKNPILLYCGFVKSQLAIAISMDYKKTGIPVHHENILGSRDDIVSGVISISKWIESDSTWLQWYRTDLCHSDHCSSTLIDLAENLLEEGRFDPKRVNRSMKISKIYAKV